MGDIDENTLKWIRSLKLSRDLKSMRDFHNGYYFGQILSKMGLSAKQNFHNKNDLSCIFHNYKEIRDVLSEKLNIDLPTDNLIGKAKQILLLLHEYSSASTSGKTLAGTSSIRNSTTQTIGMNKTTGNSNTQTLPRKIVAIQQKLQKFRDQHTKQQQTMRQQQKKDSAFKQLIVQERIREDRQKMRLANTFIKEQDQRIMEFWTNTQQVRLDRIDRDNKLQDFLRCKRQNQLKLQRQAQSKGFKEGLQAFEQNCLRLGIDIEHDPERPTQISSKQFNKVTFLQRIADKTTKEQLARKDKIKRLNNLQMMQKTTAAKTQKLYEQQNLIEKYAKMSTLQSKKSNAMHVQEKKEKYQNLKKSQQVELLKKKQINIVFDQEKEKQRQQQFRRKRIQYMEINLARKTIKRERHQEQMDDIINKLINMSCEIYDYQKNNQTEQIQKNLLQQLSEKFIMNIPGRLQKTGREGVKSMTTSKFNKAVVAIDFENYVKMVGQWITLQEGKQGMLNTFLSDDITELIDIVYPPYSVQSKEKLSVYMPLKLCLFGSSLSGKHTQALKLSQKYGVNIIDLNEIIKDALVLANPPAQEKKGSKKEPKKGEEEKPQKVRLRELGMKLKQKIKNAQQADTQTLLQVFIFKMKELFPEKTNQEIIQQFKDAQQKALEKHAQAVKEYQDALKKQKKDPKKPANTQPDKELYPKINPNPYSKGFVVVGFPNSIDKFIQFQKVITGYITPQQRINEKATENRTLASQIVHIENRKPITVLEQSVLDQIFDLQVLKQKLQERNEGRRLDPNTGISYHSKLNPLVPEVKGMIDQPKKQIVLRDQQAYKIQSYYNQRGLQVPKIKTFQRINGNLSVPQVFVQIDGLIQKVLDYKTSIFKKMIYGDDINVQPANQKIPENCDKIESNVKPDEKPKTNMKIETVQKLQNNELVPNANDAQNKTIEQSKEVVQFQQNKQQNLNLEQQQQHHPLVLSEMMANITMKKFNKICDNYSNSISSNLYKLQELRQNFVSSFYDNQRDILRILLAPDDKNIKILSFQDSYNKLLSEKQGLVQIQQAKVHLLDKLDKLYDSFWDSICLKKNQAIERRRLFMNSQWLEKHIENLLEVFEVMLQIQLNKVTELLQFYISLKLAEQQKDCIKSNDHINFDPFADGSIPFNSEDRFGKLQKIITSFKILIHTLPNWLNNVLKKNSIDINSIRDNNRVDQFLKKSIQKLQLVSTHLYNHIASRIRQYSVFFQLLLNRMDDWIIYGIKRENDIAYDHIKYIRKAINEAKKSNLVQSNRPQINQIYQPYDNIPQYYTPILQVQGVLSQEDCKLVVEELKSIKNGQGKIHLDLLKQYLGRRLKSDIFPRSLSSLSIDSIHQYLVQEDFINFQQIALCVILLGYKLPSQQEIQKMSVEFDVKQQEKQIEFCRFVERKCFIDCGQFKERVFIKYLLSDVFGSIGQWINMSSFVSALSTLNRIGAQSFSQVILQNR